MSDIENEPNLKHEGVFVSSIAISRRETDLVAPWQSLMESLRTTLVVLVIADSGHVWFHLLKLAAPGDAWVFNELNWRLG
ncbi:MAG: hypothetical protein HLUCCO16_15435 [Phormidium sp. OSCR]|nr:MAG: hypothetical protein HLUCCO16_15435 [Phormidium sp. OSCR]